MTVAAGSSIFRRDPARLVPAVRRYRVMAYVTGVVLIVLVFAGIPLQVAAHNDVIASDLGTAHGILYLIYLVAAYLMTIQVGMRPPGTRPSLRSWMPTVIVLLAGTIPVLTFVVERWVTHRYINPALSAASGDDPAGARSSSAQPSSAQPSSAQRPSAQRPG
jgi:integral membrane protein